MQDFDRFIIVDWSSRATPSSRKPTKDAIWVCEGGRKGKLATHYFRTRDSCIRHITRRLTAQVDAGHRVLVGWDFAFGYPKGLAKALRLKKKPWKAIWRLLDHQIRDNRKNHNNRFSVGADLNRRVTGGSGPFWGTSAGHSGVFLGPTKDFSYPVRTKGASLDERRLVERRVRRMQSPWKLAYAGSVGSQSLLGIPRVRQLALHAKLSEYTRIWPFETKFSKKIPPKGPLVLHVEIYPGLLELPGKDKIADREQVRSYVRWLQREQSAGRLAHWLSAPAELGPKDLKRVLKHEGWVLGVQ